MGHDSVSIINIYENGWRNLSLCLSVGVGNYAGEEFPIFRAVEVAVDGVESRV